LWRDCEQI
jgi:hypothetical protein